MKKLLLMKTMLLLCALVAGSSSVWADPTYEWVLVEDYSKLSTSDVYVIAGNYNGGTTWYSLKNNQVSSKAFLPFNSTLTISNKKITSTVSADETWVIETTSTDGEYYIKSTKGAYYLQNPSDTKNIINSKSSTDNQNIWKIHYAGSYTDAQDNTYTVTGLYNKGANRMLAIYGSNPYTWRAYGSTNYKNIDGDEVVFYKRVEIDPSSPAINATNPDKLVYNATSGEISYTIDNPVDGASVTASTTADWISGFSYATAGKVTYTIGKNTTLEDRNATVTLTYAKDATTYATKNVTVSQGYLDVKAPTFTVDAGTYNVSKSVELETETDGATIYYTTDGSTPTSSSTEYSSAIAVNVSMTIKAIAVKDGVSTAVAEAAYVLKVATPQISPNGGAFEESQNVTISCDTDGAAIYYTDNGNAPTSSSTAYSAFSLTASKTIKAIAVKDGWTDSDVASATFTKVDLNNAFILTGLSAIASDDVIAIVGNNGSNYAMSNDNGTTDGPDATSVTVSSNMISTVDNTLKWNVSGNAKDGYTFCPNGSTTTWLYCTSSNDGVRVGTGAAKLFEVKSNYLYNTGQSAYVGIYSSQDWRRYGTINANITGQSFAIYKKGISLTLAAACTDGTKYYGTFSSSVPFKFPAGVTVSEIGIVDGKLNVVNYEAGAVVPANTGVMISSMTSGKVTLTPTTASGTSVLGDANCLRPSGFGISDLTATAMSTANSGCKFYRLTMHNGTTIGFWWGAANGAAFDLAANKAYLAIPNASEARAGLWFGEGDVTAIETVKAQNVAKGEYFNLAGQRVAQPTKGLYIVNGRKVIVK